MRTAMIAVLVLGCGGSKPATQAPTNTEPTKTPAAADSSDPGRKPTETECKAAVEKTIAIARASDPQVDKGLREGDTEAQMRAMGMTECTDDWIGATVDCVMESASVPDVDMCMRNQENRAEPEDESAPPP